jgi:D-sedoheptulose 7-phosphate isomerase
MTHSDFLDAMAIRGFTLSAMTNSGVFEELLAFTNDLYYGVKDGGKLIMIGNGGSASDCDHIVGEFCGRFLLERPSVPAVSLTNSVASMTAIANDYGYEYVFSRQLRGMIGPNDSLIALTTSGNSKNIVGPAIESLKILHPNLNSLIITGLIDHVIDAYKRHIQIPIVYEKKNVACIQEMTMFLLHTMCEMFDDLYAGYKVK